MKDMKERFEKGKKRKKNLIDNRYTHKIERLRKEIDNLKGKEGKEETLQALRQEIRRIDQLRKQLPSGDPFDTEYKRLYFCRYADDFIVGIIGSHQDAERVRQEMRSFIEETLKLTIAEEKSHIRHSKEGATFVGYEVKTYSGNRIVKVKRGPATRLSKRYLKGYNSTSHRANSNNSVATRDTETMQPRKPPTDEG